MFHLIQGDDEYSVALERDRIQAGFLRGGEAALERYDGRERGVNLTEIFQAVSTLSFFETRKLVVLEYAGEFFEKEKTTLSKGNGLKILEDMLTIGDDVCVILCASRKIAKNTKVYKLIEQKGKLIELSRMWYDPNEGLTGQLGKWVSDEVKKRKMDLTPDQQKVIVGRVGSDLRLISNELDKISIFLDGDSAASLDRNMLGILVPCGRELLIFNLVDTVANKDIPRAMTYLGEVVKNGMSEVFILMMIHRQIRQIYSWQILAREKADDKTIMSELGLSPYTMKKLKAQVEYYPLPSLPRTIGALITADAEIKNSMLPPKVILEKMIIRIAR